MEKLKKFSAMALDIFRATNDGDDLPPAELKLVENAINGFLNEAGETAYVKLHARFKEGRVMKKCRVAYEDLALVPGIMAEDICDRPYTGKEMSNLSASFVSKIETLRQAMTREDKREFALQTDVRCKAAYDAIEENYFHKLVASKTNNGRDQLRETWIPHWLASFLHESHSKEFIS